MTNWRLYWDDRTSWPPDEPPGVFLASLGNGAIVRQWFKRLRSSQWTETWRSLYGGTPTPTTIADALNRRHELVRPSSIDIEQDGAFWRVVGIDHDETDEGALHGVPASITDDVSYSVVGA